MLTPSSAFSGPAADALQSPVNLPNLKSLESTVPSFLDFNDQH